MIYTIANNKGGVGKTALAAHLAFFAGEAGRSVLVIDLDAQANLTGTFVDRDQVLEAPNAAELFAQPSIATPAPITTTTKNVSLLPASPVLQEVDKSSATSLFTARKHLREYGSQYDVVIIDTPPALGLRVLTALAASDRVIAPLLPERYSTDGLNTLLQEINTVRAEMNPQLGETEFVFNLVNSTAKTHSQLIQELRKMFPSDIPNLYRHIAVADALSAGRPVWRSASHQGAAKEWKDACAALLRL